MQYPFRVAGCHVDVRPVLQAGITCALRTEEGRTRPGPAMPSDSARFQPWIKPSTAKSASSQGGALAMAGSVHKPNRNRIEDMTMEYLHD
jgi:hypothetical protein